MTSLIVSPKTSVPVIVVVFSLSPVPVVVTIIFLAPPPKKVVFARVAVVFGRAAVTIRSSSDAFSSLISLALTSEPAILISLFIKEGFPPLYRLQSFKRSTRCASNRNVF